MGQGGGTDQAGNHVSRRARAGRAGRQPREAGGRGQPALRPDAPRRGLPLPPPGRAPHGPRRVSDRQKAQVQAQFGPSAQDYVTSAGHAAGEDLERLVAWGRRRAAPRVLDVATGGGHTALAFAGFTPVVVAADLTLPMLEAARGFIRGKGVANVRFVAADVEALPFPDASFGVVTCRTAAHHFPAILNALKEVARVLAPRGSFLMQDILGHAAPQRASS